MKFYIGLFTFSLICSSALFSESSDTQKKQRNEALHLDWLNTNVPFSQDFYAYANGTWKKNNTIPPEYASWGSFNIVNNRVQEQIHQMLIKASENTRAKLGSIEQKVGDFYFSGMDEKNIDRLG